MIIFLNGTSSSGKSMIARAMMHQSERPFLYYSVDHFINFWIDEKFVAFENEPKEWFFQQHIIDIPELHGPIVEGPHTAQLHWDMVESLTVLIQKGYDLIIDEVLWNTEIFDKFTHALCQADKVYLVKVICDLIECERRESKREDRFKGLTRSLYADVYNSFHHYDLEVDTTYASANDCAKKILKYIQQHSMPRAFLDYLPTTLSFQPLERQHFQLLQSWLNTSQEISWWNEGKLWTRNEIDKKFSSMVGATPSELPAKSIRAFIIYAASQPIGYIQSYGIDNFPKGYGTTGLTKALASFDIFMADVNYTNKGLEPFLIKQFLIKKIWPHFNACFLSPATDNKSAIQILQSIGFKSIKQLKEPPVTWMVIHKP